MPIICRLRDMMAEKELKQFEVAIATKLSPTIIGNLYHNQFRRIDCKTAERLCRFFECEFGQLFELIDPPEEEETTEAVREQPSSPPLQETTEAVREQPSSPPL